MRSSEPREVTTTVRRFLHRTYHMSEAEHSAKSPVIKDLAAIELYHCYRAVAFRYRAFTANKGGGYFFFQNIYNQKADYGRCISDVASALSGFMVYALTPPTNQRIADQRNAAHCPFEGRRVPRADVSVLSYPPRN
jgi:hypothetical protein